MSATDTGYQLSKVGTIMAKNMLKIVKQLVADIVFVLSENVRDPEGDYTNIDRLVIDIRDNGQVDPVLLISKPDGPHVLRGFRRVFAFRRLLELYPNGYETTDANGKPFTRTFDKIDAVIVDGLDEAEAFAAMSDHGNVEPLSEYATRNTILRAFDFSWTEKKIVNKLRGVIDQLLGQPNDKQKLTMQTKVATALGNLKDTDPTYATRKLAAEEEAYFELRRGFIQGMHDVHKSPRMLREAYMDTVRGKASFPKLDDLKRLLKVYEAEKAKNTLNINKENPGEEFVKAYDKEVEARQNAAMVGGSAASEAKPGLMTGKDVDGIIEGSTSKILTLIALVVRKKANRECLKPLNDFLTEIEKNLTENQGIVLAQVLSVGQQPTDK